jgi:hypothetical protein
MAMFRRNHDAPDTRLRAQEKDGVLDRDLAAIFLVGWIAALVRVVLGWARHETFEAEATLALLYVLFVPMLLAKPWRYLVPWRSPSAPNMYDGHPPGPRLIHPKGPVVGASAPRTHEDG